MEGPLLRNNMTSTPVSPRKRWDPIDVHIGNRIRLARTAMQMSQAQLGEAMDLTFQQIQKYESGANRISATRLFRLSQVLHVSITYFFEGVVGKRPANYSKHVPPDTLTKFLSTNESTQLTVAFAQITNPSVRKRALDLIKSLA